LGKLSELWVQYKSESIASKKQELRQEIWKIEDWMISKGYTKQRTDFKVYEAGFKWKLGRYQSIRDGGYNIPRGAKTGKDRCKACIYNYRSYCDPNDPYGHMANV